MTHALCIIAIYAIAMIGVCAIAFEIIAWSFRVEARAIDRASRPQSQDTQGGDGAA